MGRRTCSNHPREVPRSHDRQGGTAYTHGLLLFADQPAGSHMAHFAASALVSDGTRLKRLCTFKGSIDLFQSSNLKENLGSRINGFHIFFHERFKLLSPGR
jgi:hypothetical protein